MSILKTARGQGPWVVICTLAVLTIWCVSAGANWWAGWTLSDGQGWWTQAIISAASVAVDILKAGFLFAVAYLVHQRKWFVALVTFVLFLTSAAWAVRSATYFSATMLTQHQAENARDREISNQIEENIKSLRERQGFIRQQKTEFDSDNRRSREAMLEERKRLSEEFGILQRQIDAEQEKLRRTRVVGAIDPFSLVTGWDAALITKGTSIYFAALLELLSALGLWVIAEARIRAAEKEAAAAKPRPTDAGFGAGAYVAPKSPPPAPPSPPKGGQPKPATEPSTSLAPTPKAAPKLPFAKVAAGGNVVLLPRKSEIDPKASLKAQVAQAVKECLEVGDVDGDRVLVSMVAHKVNERLPRHRKLTGAQVRNLLLPAVLSLKLGYVAKAKIGGNAWVTGVRFQAEEAARPAEKAKA